MNNAIIENDKIEDSDSESWDSDEEKSDDKNKIANQKFKELQLAK
jgi:hypothetical protein